MSRRWSAARQARCAWSSWAIGAPKSAMMPSPVNLSTKPSKRSTPSARMAKKRCMICDHSSGSSCSASSMEPFTSAKSTVTCLRSPSRADFDWRILSARCRDVGARGACRVGATAARSDAAMTAAPHSRQNLAPAGSSAPQPAQRTANGVPHSRQNLAESGLSWPQLAQFIQRAPVPSARLSARRRSRRRTSHRTRSPCHTMRSPPRAQPRIPRSIGALRCGRGHRTGSASRMVSRAETSDRALRPSSERGRWHPCA